MVDMPNDKVRIQTIMEERSTSVDSGVLITSNLCTLLMSSNFILILY